MSNIVKFPGQEEESVPDNLVRFASKAEIAAHEGKARAKQRRSFFGGCAVSAKVLFKGLRYAAAISLHLSLTIPLAVIGGFRWLICFFSMMALIGTWIFNAVMSRQLSEAQRGDVDTIYLVGWGLIILGTFAQPLAEWIAEKRIAYRLFGL